MSTELIVFLTLLAAAQLALAYIVWKQTTINRLVFKKIEVVEKTAAAALMAGAVPMLERLGGKLADAIAAKQPKKPTPTEPSEEA